MKRMWCGLALWLAMTAVHAAGTAVTQVQVQGPADKDIPAWTLQTLLPDGWTQDCCLYAKAIGVNLVLYKGEWTGDPERVMVLNIWTSKLSSLEAELQDDRHRYLNRDPGGKVDAFALDNHGLPCRGVLYQGTDHKDDVVVFCDPGLASGIRLSWSMTLAHDDPERGALLALFRGVAEQTTYAVTRSARDIGVKTRR